MEAAMPESLSLFRLRTRVAANHMREVLSGSRLRLAVVLILALMFWALMYAMFFEVFVFLAKFEGIRDLLVDYLFAFFFLALLVMMVISNAIISYTSLFRSEESSFLLALPLHSDSIFTYKATESLLFSSWGMVTLILPMIVAYGLTSGVPWYFYPFACAISLIFLLLPAELGAVVALVITVSMPRRRKKTLALCAAGAVLLIGVLWMWPLITGPRPRLFSEAGLKVVVGRIAFSQHWALPSRWVSEGILAAGRDEMKHATFMLLMLLSNVMFLGLVAAGVGRALYRRAWASAQGLTGKRKYRAFSPLDAALSALLFFLRPRLRLLVLKDMKTFRRDPVQWSQCLLFFGMLALYIMNIPRLGFTHIGPYWHNLVSVLNLGATCMTLAMFTSRFIFPQLSLEGRRIWLVGLMPLQRSTILWGKFFFATAGSLLISVALTVLSDVMLGLPAWVMGVHGVVVVCACCGLNGLAVGLGAVYPNTRTDDPSKIISSFGGTLNLICSISLVLASVMVVALPLQLHATGKLSGNAFLGAIATALAIEMAIGAAACLIPMAAGMRSFRKMEF